MAEDFKFQSAEALCIRHWKEFLSTDPELARIELALSNAAQLLSREWRGSNIYAQALKQWRFYRDARQRLLDLRYPR